VLIANVTLDPDTNGIGPGTPSGTGWTLIDQNQGETGAGDTGPYIYVFGLRVAADTATSTTFSWTSASSAAISMVSYSGAYSAGAVTEANSSDGYNDDASPAHTAITTLGAQRVIVACIADRGTSLTVPSGLTQRVSAAQGHGARIADAVQAAAGASTAYEWTGGASGNDSGLVLLAIAPEVTPVWKAGEDIVVGASATVTRVARSTNPFTHATAPVVTTDYVISAGGVSSITLDRTSGTEVVISITATGAGCTLEGPAEDPEGGLRLRADPLEVITDGARVGIDATSQTSYGLREAPSAYSVWPVISAANAQTLADDIITAFKDPREVVGFTVYGNRHDTAMTQCLSREISDRVRILLTRGNVDVTGWIESIQHHVGTGKLHSTTFTIRETV
jgi:hypothetical protein